MKIVLNKNYFQQFFYVCMTLICAGCSLDNTHNDRISSNSGYTQEKNLAYNDVSQAVTDNHFHTDLNHRFKIDQDAEYKNAAETLLRNNAVIYEVFPKVMIFIPTNSIFTGDSANIDNKKLNLVYQIATFISKYDHANINISISSVLTGAKRASIANNQSNTLRNLLAMQLDASYISSNANIIDHNKIFNQYFSANKSFITITY